MMAGSDHRDAAVTVAQPGAERFFRRAVVVFRWRWWLFLLPALVLTAAGAMQAYRLPASYRSTAILSVANATYLETLSAARPAGVSYETPSTVTARSLSDLLATDDFATQVAKNAGLDTALASGSLTLKDIRAAVFASRAGDSLVAVTGEADNPSAAAALTQATIDAFVDYVRKSEISQSDAAQSFYGDLSTKYKAAVDNATTALDDYLVAHPEPKLPAERDIAETVAIQRLNTDLTNAQEQYKDAQGKAETARLATAQTEADIEQRYQVLDAPVAPTAPTSGLKTKAIRAIVFMMMGLIISLGSVAIVTYRDHTVHNADDLEVLGVPILAVVARDKRARIPSPARLPPVAALRPHQVPVRAAG